MKIKQSKPTFSVFTNRQGRIAPLRNSIEVEGVLVGKKREEFVKRIEAEEGEKVVEIVRYNKWWADGSGSFSSGLKIATYRIEPVTGKWFLAENKTRTN